MINIIGGTKKRTKIYAPLNNVRPTSAQKRESMFSIIESYSLKMDLNIFKKFKVLDLFAGSGALGLEAISRGAEFAYFYENNIDVIYQLKKNCLKICKKNNFCIKVENILKSQFQDINNEISLVFIDPPYKINPFEKILNNIYKSKILSKNAIIVLECYQKTNVKLPPFFLCFNERIYGKTKIIFLINKVA